MQMREHVAMKIAGVIVALIVIPLFDLRGLFQASESKKARAVYFSIMAINLIVSILLISGVELISPAMILEKVVRVFIPGDPIQ